MPIAAMPIAALWLTWLLDGIPPRRWSQVGQGHEPKALLIVEADADLDAASEHHQALLAHTTCRKHFGSDRFGPADANAGHDGVAGTMCLANWSCLGTQACAVDHCVNPHPGQCATTFGQRRSSCAFTIGVPFGFGSGQFHGGGVQAVFLGVEHGYKLPLPITRAGVGTASTKACAVDSRTMFRRYSKRWGCPRSNTTPATTACALADSAAVVLRFVPGVGRIRFATMPTSHNLPMMPTAPPVESAPAPPVVWTSTSAVTEAPAAQRPRAWATVSTAALATLLCVFGAFLPWAEYADGVRRSGIDHGDGWWALAFGVFAAVLGGAVAAGTRSLWVRLALAGVGLSTFGLYLVNRLAISRATDLATGFPLRPVGGLFMVAFAALAMIVAALAMPSTPRWFHPDPDDPGLG